MQRFAPIEDVFKGRHFDRQIIVLCVSWYTSFKLSSRDLVIMMADRGISVTHTTILRWVQRYLPEFEKRWRRYARTVGGSWRMDETYIKGPRTMGVPRVAKNIERVDNMRSSIMDAGQNGQSMGASFGVCDWLGESGTASAKRISRGGKPDSESSPSAAISSHR